MRQRPNRHREHNIDLTNAAATHNREAWDSYRQQRDKGLVVHRRSLAEEIQEGKLFLEERWTELLGNVHGKQLLDLGCGDGGESCCWARLGARVVGVDNSPVQLEAAKKIAEELGLECNFVLADILQLPENLMNEEFDFVFSDAVAAWIGDLKTWFGNVYKALKPEGSFLFVGDHPVTKFTSEVLMGETSETYRTHYFNEGVFIRREADERSTGNPAGEDFTTYQWAHTLTSLLGAMKYAGFSSIEMYETDTGNLECKQLVGMPTGILILASK